MNRTVHTIGDATSVAYRFGCEPSTASPGANSIRGEKLVNVMATNTSAGLLYLQIHEIAPGINVAAPIDTAVPKFSFPVQAGLGGTFGEEVDLSGIYVCWSTTQATKTLAGASGEINILVKA